MQPLSENELKRFAPQANRDYIDALVQGWPQLVNAGIDTPARICEFLGQHAHETGGFTIVRENTNWSVARIREIGRENRPWAKVANSPRLMLAKGDPVRLANLVYSNRRDLGNTGGNDGWDYRGGSFCQLTGRGAYREAGGSISLPLEDKPQLIERGEVGLRVAIWYWLKRDCNRFADRGYTRAIGNAINRGNPYSSKEPIGADGRKQWRDRALAIFGDSKTIHAEGLALGAYGSEVEVLQRRLKELRYGVGGIDSVFGPQTARAVAAFKLDHKREHGAELEPDEVVGSDTWAALNLASPVVMAERAEATEKDLIAAGSQETAAGQNAKAAGYVTTGLGVAGGLKQADDAGMIEPLKNTVSWVPEVHSTLTPVVSAATWAFSHIWWVLAIVGGVWFWASGRHVIAARLKAHTEGWNLFR